MNHVTNVILTSFVGDKANLDKLNGLSWYKGGRGLISCADKRFQPPWYGGSKHLEMNVWLGAFRELDVEELVSAIRQLEWGDPECVRLFVCEGGAGRFTRIDCALRRNEPED